MNKAYSIILIVFSFIWLSIGTSFAQDKPQKTEKVSLLVNNNLLIPFKQMSAGSIQLVCDSPEQFANFIHASNRYLASSVISYATFQQQSSPADTLVFLSRADHLHTQRLLDIQKAIAGGKKVVLCKLSTTPATAIAAVNLSFGGKITEILVDGNTKKAQEELAMSLFGGTSISPSKVSLAVAKTRLQYDQVDLTALDIRKMTKEIDAIANEAIKEKATPGMVVMAIQNGKVIFEKAYGYHTYEKKIPTRVTDIFDLASISKIAGTTPVIMNLYDNGLLKLDHTIGDYLPEVKGKDKANITLRSVLLHEAGFTPFIPFYKEIKKGDLQQVYSESHQVKVADSAYLKNNYYHDVMWPEMMNSPLKTTGKYVYSDISMYVMKEIAEHITKQPMDEFVTETFFQPIGMWSAGYNPRKRFERNQIVPTEDDTSFRKVLLEGYVHDQGAAMAGGVAGHAGLFATANDLAIYGQMLLNRGEYGGVRYFKPETIDLFTSSQSAVSRRGLGFDRADPDKSKEYPSKLANSSVYGHTGYTGTCIWIDPKNQLIYIFLSNRVHPQVSPKLYNLNIRSRIQDVIYETINAAKK